MSKKQKIKMLLINIDKARYQIKTILQRLNDAMSEGVLSRLVQEELLSSEQYQKLMKNNSLDLSNVVNIIKEPVYEL